MIEKKDVGHIAGLAHIALTPQEEERFSGELSAILRFVEELNELDIAGAAPVSGGTDLENVMRDDAPLDESLEGKAEELLAAVPRKQDGRARVKSVF